GARSASFISALGEIGKSLDHRLVNRSLERNDQVGKLGHLAPPPAVELGLSASRLDVDLAVVAPKPHCEPALTLAAIFALERNAEQGLGQVVRQPLRDFSDYFGAGDPGFLAQLAIGRVDGRLAFVDTTLGHLPDVRGLVADPLRKAPPRPY